MRNKICEAVTEFPKEKVVKTDEGWIIRDVVLLSEFSKNVDPQSGKHRRYTKETQDKAFKLFEDVPVNVNHMRKTDAKVERDVRETIGKVTAPRTRTINRNGKIEYQTVGDIVLVACESANQIAGLARLSPKGGPGMSLTGDGAYDVKEDYANVIELEPATVDVVATPATTKSFFESELQELLPLGNKKRVPNAQGGTKNPKDTGETPPKSPHDDETVAHDDRAPEKQHPSAQSGGKGGLPQPGQKHQAAMGKAAPTDDQKIPKKPGMQQEQPQGDGQVDPTDPNAKQQDQNAAGKDNYGNGDQDGDQQQAQGGGDIDAITSEANMATDTANSDKTAEAHFAAMFAHMLAAGQIYQMGNMARAKAHADKARQHEGIALNLKQNDAQQGVTAAPPRADAPKQTDGVAQKLTQKKYEGCAPWVAKLFEQH